MTDTAKPTPGPYSVHHTTGYGLTLRSDSKKCRFVRTPSGSIAHCTIPAEEAQANMELVYEAFETHHETNLTPRQLLERVRELEAEKQDMLSVLQNIGVYGCGMLSQPAAMNATEESWLRMRIQEMEFVAREAFFKYRGQEAAIAKHGEGV